MRKLLIALLWLVSASAFADVKPITWGSYGNPVTVCSSMSGTVINLTYGLPTQWDCELRAGGYNRGFVSMPTCPDGYLVDFSKLLCVTQTTEVSDQWLKAILICLCVVGFGVGVVAGQQR